MRPERLDALIKEYQARIQEAVALFRTHRNIAPLEWSRVRLPQSGFIDLARTVSYAFHGDGCLVDLPTGIVDWDFGYGERCDGINAWFLWEFALDGTTNFPEFADKAIFDAAFAEAVSQGHIKKLYHHHQDDLYYVVE